MTKYIRKDKHFRHLYNKSELEYFYLKFMTKFLTINEFYFLENTSVNFLKKNKLMAKIGRYRSRINNRCVFTGRGNAVTKKFRITRSQLRLLILSGKLPGVRKSSW